MNKSEIEALIGEYNAVEQAQEDRLVAIFRAMRDDLTGGNRRLNFSSGDSWGPNQLHKGDEERISLPAIVTRMSRFVERFHLGE